MLITADQLQEIMPSIQRPEIWANKANQLFPHYDIITPKRAAAFIGQCAFESRDFNAREENLRYSAKRLNEVFPKYFARAGRNASAYAYDAPKIANVVYANRMENGPISSGDGWRFRGRGIIQLTGRQNYRMFARYINMPIEDVTTYVETPQGALESALWYWSSNGLNYYADRWDIKELTRRINGGYHGLRERVILCNKALAILERGPQPALSTKGAEVESDKPTAAMKSRVSKQGSKGKYVRMIQQRLVDLGWLALAVDGDYGPNTSQAVSFFQQQNGLYPDGQVGPKTAEVLFN